MFTLIVIARNVFPKGPGFWSDARSFVERVKDSEVAAADPHKALLQNEFEKVFPGGTLIENTDMLTLGEKKLELGRFRPTVETTIETCPNFGTSLNFHIDGIPFHDSSEKSNIRLNLDSSQMEHEIPPNEFAHVGISAITVRGEDGDFSYLSLMSRESYRPDGGFLVRDIREGQVIPELVQDLIDIDMVIIDEAMRQYE